jgi:glycosyltransferase 2 family protein
LPSPSSPASSRASRWAWLIGLAVSVVLLGWTLHDIKPHEVLAYARRADPWLLGLAVVLATLTFPIRTWRWQVMLRGADGGRLPFLPLWHATAVGFMANNLLPARAGEFARAYVARRQLRVRFTTALASIAVERVMDGLVMVGLMALAIAAPSFPRNAQIGTTAVSRVATAAALAFGAALLAALAVVHRPAPWLSFFNRVAHALLPTRFADRLGRLAEGLIGGLEVLRRPGRFAAVVAWSLALWLVNAAAFAVCFRAFSMPVPAEGALLLQAIIGFGVALPSSPGFVGVFELATRYTLLVYGIGADLAVSYALTYHLTTFLPITLLGLYSLRRVHVPLGALQTARQEA